MKYSYQYKNLTINEKYHRFQDYKLQQPNMNTQNKFSLVSHYLNCLNHNYKMCSLQPERKPIFISDEI